MARKMSSPKNSATLSTAAAEARISQRVLSGSGPYRFSAAASATGAISGRTICAWPPSEVMPRAALSCRITKYTSRRRPVVAVFTRETSARARSWRPERSRRPMTGRTSQIHGRALDRARAGASS